MIGNVSIFKLVVMCSAGICCCVDDGDATIFEGTDIADNFAFKLIRRFK